MGELFRRFRPETALAWTGERLVSNLGGTIEGEHLHRYFLARDLCRGMQVLDIACGEGYGSALLAQTAVHVTGADIDRETVEFAKASYQVPNLTFLEASAICIPLAAGSVDAVVSFETLEHFNDHESFLLEVKRVLKPGGLFILSTPDLNIYSGPGVVPNAFHVREVTPDAFAGSLKANFMNVGVLHQRFLTGSAVFPEVLPDGRETHSLVYEQRSPDIFERNSYLARSPYLIGVASDASLPSVGPSLYIQDVQPGGISKETQAELLRLRDIEVELHSQQTALEQWTQRATGAEAQVFALQVEIDRLKIGDVEVRRESDLLRAELLSKSQEISELAARQQVRAPLISQDKDTEDHLPIVEERDDLARRLVTLQRQLETSVLLTHQQSLLLRRSQLSFQVQSKALVKAEAAFQKQSELCQIARSETASAITRYRTLATELKSVREQLEQQTDLTNRIASFLIPVRVRKFLPSRLRNFSRVAGRSSVSDS